MSRSARVLMEGWVRVPGHRAFDRTLMLPVRYSAGLMLGDEPFGLGNTPSSRPAPGW